jgi:hypothetical protein
MVTMKIRRSGMKIGMEERLTFPGALAALFCVSLWRIVAKTLV